VQVTAVPPRFAVGAALGLLAMVPAGAIAGLLPVTPWPEVADPPRSHTEWVARDARVNGLPMRIEHFDSEVSSEEVLAFYQAAWSKLPAGAPHRKRVGEWDTLSTIFGPFEIAVQVRASSPQGSQGLVSISNRGEIDKHWRPRDWPRWPGTSVSEVTDSVDGARRSQMVAMVSRDDYDITVQRWREEWTRRGYALAHEAEPPAVDGNRTWVGLFDKPPYQLDVTVTWSERSRKSFIAANWLSPARE
jgi:hypothetical protein